MDWQPDLSNSALLLLMITYNLYAHTCSPFIFDQCHCIVMFFTDLCHFFCFCFIKWSSSEANKKGENDPMLASPLKMQRKGQIKCYIYLCYLCMYDCDMCTLLFAHCPERGNLSLALLQKIQAMRSLLPESTGIFSHHLLLLFLPRHPLSKVFPVSRHSYPIAYLVLI